jgi:hypothetical protein
VRADEGSKSGSSDLGPQDALCRAIRYRPKRVNILRTSSVLCEREEGLTGPTITVLFKADVLVNGFDDSRSFSGD